MSNHLGNVMVVVSDRKVYDGNVFKADLVSTTDYYAFGMVISDRSWNTEGYRWGFNGKENDNEVKGTGNQQDYGMRIYDPRLGRFLSVDPLMTGYPELTPYQFASNTPIQAVDLDGMEKLDVQKSTNPDNGLPGTAKITILKDYKVITAGLGAVEVAAMSFSQAGVQTVYDDFEANNSTGKYLKLSKLPTKEQEGILATPEQISKGDYYETEIEFKISIDVDKNNDLASSFNWFITDNTQRGLITMPFSDTEAASADINSKIDKVYSVSLSLVVKEANDRSKYFQTEKGQKAIASGALGKSSGSLDMIFLNGNKINSVPSVSSSEILAHEIGHNIAKLNLHGTGDYEYEQEGLQSNQPGKIHPTQQNVMNIINDERNRSTIKE